MSLVIGIVLLVVLLLKLAGEGADSAVYEKDKMARSQACEDFESKYVDRKLENDLRSFIEDPQNRECVFNEIAVSCEQTKYWKGFKPRLSIYEIPSGVKKKEAQAIVDEEYFITLNIMLANRGKVSWHTSMCGFGNAGLYIVRGRNRELRERWFEYPELVMKILNEQGVPVQLVCLTATAYQEIAWKGSWADINRLHNPTCVDFTRALIEQEEISIPKPYYEYSADKDTAVEI